MTASNSERANHEDTLRVLFEVVTSYQTWRDTELGLPNELSDDAVRIGEQHLRESNWWPNDQQVDTARATCEESP